VGPDAPVEGEGDVDVVGAEFCELGIAGSAGTAVCLPAVPFAMTNAMTNAVTSTTAAAAAIHSQRGAFGRPDVGSGVG
jgi:membrane peptidoglycan carboxypeptidase